jgi:hypothetical protein
MVKLIFMVLEPLNGLSPSATLSPCDGASFIENQKPSHAIGDAVLDFDLDLVLDLDSFFDRAPLDGCRLVQVYDQVQVHPIRCHAEMASFLEEVTGETLRLKTRSYS